MSDLPEIYAQSVPLDCGHNVDLQPADLDLIIL